MKKIDFVALGYVSNDYIARVPEIPIDRKLQMISHTVQGGGPAAVAAVAASRLGVSSALLSSVGSDDPGKRIIQDLQDDKVDTSGIPVRRDCGSPIAYCWVDDAGKRSIVWTMNGLELLTPGEVPEDMVRNAGILHLDGHHPAAARHAAAIAKDAGVPVALDAGSLNDSTAELAKIVDILITSEPFAKAATGKDDPVEALTEMRNMYPAKVLGATFGSAGSFFWIDGKVVNIPAFKVKAVDTTGAGDSFHAGFEVAYVETGDIIYSARFASAVAALKCTKIGARAGLPDRQSVLDFLDSNNPEKEG